LTRAFDEFLSHRLSPSVIKGLGKQAMKSVSPITNSSVIRNVGCPQNTIKLLLPKYGVISFIEIYRRVRKIPLNFVIRYV